MQESNKNLVKIGSEAFLVVEKYRYAWNLVQKIRVEALKNVNSVLFWRQKELCLGICEPMLIYLKCFNFDVYLIWRLAKMQFLVGI